MPLRQRSSVPADDLRRSRLQRTTCVVYKSGFDVQIVRMNSSWSIIKLKLSTPWLGVHVIIGFSLQGIEGGALLGENAAYHGET